MNLRRLALAAQHCCRTHRFSFATLLTTLLLSSTAFAQVSVTTLGAKYEQKFDSLPASLSATWVNNVTIPGWYSARTGTATTIVANNGGSNAGALYSYGATGVAERALGSLGSGNSGVGSLWWGVSLRNDTGSTITSLTVQYTGEQWRHGGGSTTNPAVAQTAAFSYVVTPAFSGTRLEFETGGVPVSQLDFTSPVFPSVSGAALVGNDPANQRTMSHTITGLSIPPGTEVALRWSDPDHSGSDHGLAIDEFSVIANGDATSTVLSAVAAATPDSGIAGTSTLLTVNVTPATNPDSTGITVIGNLLAIGHANHQQLYDDGSHGDATPNDNVFSFAAIVAPEIPAGPRSLTFTVSDQQGGEATASASFTVVVQTDPTGTGSANPSTVSRGSATILTISVTPGTNPASSGITVTGNLTSIGGSAAQAFTASGNTFTFNASIPGSTAAGLKSIPIIISDAQSRTSTTSIALTVTVPTIPAGSVVISQFYGGGGNAGSTLRNDFIELFNRTGAPVSLDGWSVQHFSQSNAAAGWLATPLSGTIQPYSYYLIEQAAGTTPGGGTTPLPAPDATGTIPMGSTAGLVALSTSTTPQAAMCSIGSDVVDFVGYGGTSCSGRVALGNALSNTTAASRVLGGCKYTPAATDFAVGPPAPRNSATQPNDCNNVVPPANQHVMISQIYGGGGNSNASFTNDFVELYNPTDSDVSLEGWSIQYASSTGSSWSSNMQPLGGSIPSHGYFLIELSGGTSGDGASLPPPRIIGDINMSATNGKLALVTSFRGLSGNCPIGDSTLVDFIGYGTADCFEGGIAALAMSNTQSLIRSTNSDTDQNSVDFSRVTPSTPRGTGELVELPPVIGSFEPGATNAPRDASITLNFSEPVDVVSGWFSITCNTTGTHSDVKVATAFDARAWIITPNQTFTPGETCTVQIFKDLVSDRDTIDGPNTDNLPADFQWTFTIATGATVESAAIHMTMGNPSDAIDSQATPDNYLMTKPEFALSYNSTRGTANWVSWHLSDLWVTSGNRTDTFRPDPALPPTWYRVLQTDYSGSGFDRGHMAPSADRSINIPINQATFLMTNMVPQTPDNNQGPWEAFESYLRTLIPCPGPCNEIYIVTGPDGAAGTIANGNVTVPASTWKVALVLPKLDGNDVQRVTPAATTIAINIPNVTGIRNDDWTKYLTTVNAIEQMTGYDFFSNVPEITQNSIEFGTNGVNPPGVANQSTSTDEDQSVNITLQAVSPAVSPVYSYTIVTSPAHGTLSGSGETYTYTPAPDFHGTDSFTFRVNDGQATSNTARVTVSVASVNDAPVLAPITAQTVILGNVLTFTDTATDVDVPVQSLTYGLASAPAGATIDPATGAFSWTPVGSDAGLSFQFAVTVTDGLATTSTPVSVAVVDAAAPVISALTLSTTSLWPVNHAMINVSVSYTAVDAGDTAPACKLVVTSNEPVTGTGDGDTGPDWEVVDANNVRLRAERAGTGNGRVYSVIAECSDRFGNLARSAAATVSVAKSQGRN